MNFSSERLPKVWDELQPLLRAHHEETGVLSDHDFSPDRKRYEQLDASGMLRTFLARDSQGKIVGYEGFLVAPHLHYPSLIVGIQDVIYMDPKFRGKPVLDFIDWTDASLAAEGVGLVTRTVNRKRDWSRLLERKHYWEQERGYAKLLSVPGGY